MLFPWSFSCVAPSVTKAGAVTGKKTTTQNTSGWCFLGILVICLGTSVQVAFVKCAYNIPHKISDEAVFQSLFRHPTNGSCFAQWVQYVGPNSIWSGIAALKSLGFLVGFLVAGCLAEKLGRRGALTIALLVCFVGVCLQASSKSELGFWYFSLGYFIHSFGASMTMPVFALFITEVMSKTKSRTFFNLNPVFVLFFMPIIMALGLPELLKSADLWPYFFIFSSASIIVTVTALFFMPESPKYLCLGKQKNIEKIEKSLRFYFGSTFCSFYYIEELQKEELYHSPPAHGFAAIRFAWESGSYRMQYVYLVFFAGILEIVGFSSAVSILSSRAANSGWGLDEHVVNYSTVAVFFMSFLALLLSSRSLVQYGKRTMFLLGSGVQIFSYLGLSVLGFCISNISITPIELRYGFIFFLCMAATSHQIGIANLPNASIQDHLSHSSLGQPAKTLGYAVGCIIEFAIVLGFVPLENVGLGYPWLTIVCPLIAGYVYFAHRLTGLPHRMEIPVLEDVLDEHSKLHWPMKPTAHAAPIPLYDSTSFDSSHQGSEKKIWNPVCNTVQWGTRTAGKIKHAVRGHIFRSKSEPSKMSTTAANQMKEHTKHQDSDFKTKIRNSEKGKVEDLVKKGSRKIKKVKKKCKKTSSNTATVSIYGNQQYEIDDTDDEEKHTIPHHQSRSHSHHHHSRHHHHHRHHHH